MLLSTVPLCFVRIFIVQAYKKTDYKIRNSWAEQKHCIQFFFLDTFRVGYYAKTYRKTFVQPFR